MTVLAYDPADQRTRRRRARITIATIAGLLNISTGAVSQYENGKEALPWALDSEDYERALLQAINEKRGGSK